MEYVSTRGSAPALDFEGATLAGLAADGGLCVPREWPRFTLDEIAAMRGLPYPELAARVMRPFVGDSLAPERLRELCDQAYGRFAHVAVTPLTQLDERQWLLELFHGPTLAFKDVALQLLGLLFEEFLSRRDDRLTIVGATSGDPAPMEVARLFFPEVTVTGATMGTRDELAQLVAFVAHAGIEPPVDSSYALTDARAAFERLAGGAQFGKVVVRP